MKRLAALDEGAMTGEQRDVYRKILASRGSIRGPFRAWLENPELADRAQALGELVRFGTSLPSKLKELAILTTASFWGAELEWSIHEPAARREGIEEASIRAIAAGEEPAFVDPMEVEIHRFTRALLRDHVVPEDVFGKTRAALGTKGVSELTLLIGYYSLVAMTLNAFEMTD